MTGKPVRKPVPGIEVVRPAGRSEVLPDDRPGIEVGQWYWVRRDERSEERAGTEEWFGCVTEVGSNYAEVRGVGRGDNYVARIHFDNFWDECRPEPDPDSVIGGNVDRSRAEVNRLLGRVKELTARLGVGDSPALASGSETQALARVTSDQPVEEYKAALVRASKEELPDLFEKIKMANEDMAEWMGAQVVPMKARAAGLREIIGRVNDRIFSVELYAGLTESVACVREGEPAGLAERVRLLQRRHYMDEECLANYRTGGMEFKNIGAFDGWMAERENMERILPFPRCVVALKVRRASKEREMVNISDYFRIVELEEADRATFLYIRNGERLYRMRTGVEFDEKLFPDMDGSKLTGKLYGKVSGSSVDDIITEDDYKARVEEHCAEVAEWRARKKAYGAAMRSPEAKARAKERGLKRPDDSCVDLQYVSPFEPYDHGLSDYHPFDPSDVHYDDIMGKIQEGIRAHNRIGLILQGLLDRSPVFHPHPPWQIWTGDGFRQALELVYDESRALVAGEKPDFEEYRKGLNASLREGSVTVGQEDAWERAEAAKECRRLDNDYRTRHSWRPDRFRPHGDPGPGILARVSRFAPGARRCTYGWDRERQTVNHYGPNGPVRRTLTVHESAVLNVDAYKPGDFKKFFNDPRTRAEYLKWAPLLLEAEEYHAGNRKVRPPPRPSRPAKSSFEGARRYRMRKLRKSLVGKAVRLTRIVTTTGEVSYETGSLWRVSRGSGEEFAIVGILEDGRNEIGPNGFIARMVFNVRHTESSPSFEVDPSVPAEPKEEE